MNKTTKVWLMVAAALVLTGCAVFTGGMMMLNWNFSKLSTVSYETTEHEIAKDFMDIAVKTDTADITFAVSENEKSTVVCHEQKHAVHRVTVKEDSLVVELIDERKWYEHIGIGFDTPKITVYLPQQEYGALSISSATGSVVLPDDFSFRQIDITESTGNVVNRASATESLKIKATTGNIRVENITAGWLDLTVSTGKVTVSDVTCQGNAVINVSTGDVSVTGLTCKNLITDGSTGDIVLNNAIAAEKFSVTRSTGDVKFDHCDAAEIFVQTDTGKVTGSLLTDKAFIVQSDTGRVDVPKTVTGGRCEITTDTGDIRITVG